jgi:lysophospholipase L1-like esterase
MSQLKYKFGFISGIVTFGLACWLYGILTFYLEIFPFQQIREVKNLMLGGTLSEERAAKLKQAEPTAYQNSRNNLFQAFTPKVDVVMIGDSLTNAFEWADISVSNKIANRGIGGDTAEDILNRLEPIFALKPQKAFLMFGINDIYARKPVNDIFNNYINIIKNLRKNQIEVYIVSTVECSLAICGARLETVRLLNQKLAEYAKNEKIIYININSTLSNDKLGLLSEYTPDGIHLLANGYGKWVAMIKPFIDTADTK